MRRSVPALVALALLVQLAPAAAAPAPAAVGTAKVIVQLSGPPARGGASVAALHAQHDGFAQRIKTAGIKASVGHEFTQLLNAVTVTTTTAEQARLRALPGVVGVYPDLTMHASTEPDLTVINAPQVWQSTDPTGHQVQGVGQTVAVLDTGIDYTHPDLGAGFGEGHKVVAGYDFVNNDPDPADDNGHGTHVAGIIAADPAQPGGRQGVAPQADLTAYKVLDATGSGDEATIIEGLDAAVSPDNPHRADIVNMSLSGPPRPQRPPRAGRRNRHPRRRGRHRRRRQHRPRPSHRRLPRRRPRHPRRRRERKRHRPADDQCHGS